MFGFVLKKGMALSGRATRIGNAGPTPDRIGLLIPMYELYNWYIDGFTG